MKERVMDNIEPKVVFKYFQDLSEIPRGSGNEKKASEYIIEFAKENDLEWYSDDAYNVIIRKDAYEGYEDHPTVILQGHIDMVCEKNQDTIHNFEKDPIKLIVEGDVVRADGTTLGADNGLGVSMILTILSDENIEHPRLEAVFTTNEETGMSGAEELDKEKLEGEILINLDANDEGYFVVGCAGGPAVMTEIPVERIKGKYDPYKKLKLKIRGLIGGHSGEDIHRGRANAIKLMVRSLMAIDREMDLHLAEFDSGVQYNAIPREADAIILVREENINMIKSIVDNMNKVFKNEYRVTDNQVELTVSILEEITCDDPLTKKSKDDLLNYLYLADNGIVRMNMDFEDTVESSLSIGVVRLDKDRVLIQTLTRSSLESMYMDMYYKILKLAEISGGNTSIISNCLEWEYNPRSDIKDIFEKTYLDMYGEEAKSMILHAGLECGIFSKNLDRSLDIVAAGPNIRDLHTPGEYFTISSTSRFWDFLLEVLKRLK